MKKKIESRKCVICGKKFAPKTANASVCSDKCRKTLKAKHDKSRKAAKKSTKPTTKKPVKLTEKINLPKKIRVKAVIHDIKPNDIIRSDKSFEPERILFYALRLTGLACAMIAKDAAKKGK